MIEAKEIRNSNLLSNRSNSSKQTRYLKDYLSIQVKECPLQMKYGLFDYKFDKNTNVKQGLEVFGCSHLITDPHTQEIASKTPDQTIPNKLLSIAFNLGNYYAYQGDSISLLQVGGQTKEREDFYISEQIKELTNLAYQVVPTGKGVQLEVGDIFRLARVPYIVKELRINKINYTNNSYVSSSGTSHSNSQIDSQNNTSQEGDTDSQHYEGGGSADEEDRSVGKKSKSEKAVSRKSRSDKNLSKQASGVNNNGSSEYGSEYESYYDQESSQNEFIQIHEESKATDEAPEQLNQDLIGQSQQQLNNIDGENQFNRPGSSKSKLDSNKSTTRQVVGQHIEQNLGERSRNQIIHQSYEELEIPNLADTQLIPGIPEIFSSVEGTVSSARSVNKTSLESSLKATDEERICRICLGSDQTRKNPLIQPCECQGTAGLIHIDCLKEWLGQQHTSVFNRSSVNFVWKINKCELCQTTYPDKVIIDEKGTEVQIFQIQRPISTSLDYVLVEVLGLSQGKNVQLILLGGDLELTLGKGSQDHTRVLDGTVSKAHAKMRIENRTGKLFLSDNNSRFGTLKLIQKPLVIPEEHKHGLIKYPREATQIQIQTQKYLLTIQRRQRKQKCWDSFKTMMAQANLCRYLCCFKKDQKGCACKSRRKGLQKFPMQQQPIQAQAAWQIGEQNSMDIDSKDKQQNAPLIYHECADDLPSDLKEHFMRQSIQQEKIRSKNRMQRDRKTKRQSPKAESTANLKDQDVQGLVGFPSLQYKYKGGYIVKQHKSFEKSKTAVKKKPKLDDQSFAVSVPQNETTRAGDVKKIQQLSPNNTQEPQFEFQ